MGFSQASRDQVRAWGRKLADSYSDDPHIAYYEIAMLEDVPRVIRGWVTRKIREQVSVEGQLHFLPVSSHEAEWKAAAEFHNPDAAYILLVDGSGTVVWRTHGPLSDAAFAELTRRLQHLIASR